MMPVRGRLLSFLILAAAVAAVLALGGEAYAQCAMCRASVEGAGDTTARTMNFAILVLLVPPVAIFCSIFAVAYKRGRGGGG